MAQMVQPHLSTREANTAIESAYAGRRVQLTAADQALIRFSISLAIAVACGTAAGVFVYCTGSGDGRAGAAAGGAAFGAVLGVLMVWRMCAGR